MIKVVAKLGGISNSPKKINVILKTIRSKPVFDALKMLQFMDKQIAPVVSKVLSSAISNAEHNYGLSANNLFVDQATSGLSLMLKRLDIKGRGRSGRITKKKSHIYFRLSEKEVA